MKKLILIISLIFFNVKCDQRNLSIVIDLNYNDVVNYSSFTNTILHGLIQSKKTPILTNVSILKGMLQKISKHNFKNEDWIVYRYNNFLLLIPKEYKVLHEDAGFNLNKLKLENDLSSYHKKSNYIFEEFFHDYLSQFKIFYESKNFINFLNLIFGDKKDTNFEWNIYFAGHGNFYFTICGLYENDFKRFLNILETKIKTKVLYYSSCFAGGKMRDFIYKQDDADLTFSYPIFCQSMTDSFVQAYSKFNYSKFMDKLFKVDTNDNKTIKKLIKNVYDQYEKRELNPSNIVLYRPANEKQFKIVEINNEVCSLNEITDNEIIIDQNYLLLNKPVYNEINISQKTKIASLLPGENCHYIKRINCYFSYIDLFKNFYPIDSLVYQKIYLIDQVQCIDDKLDELILDKVLIKLKWQKQKNEKKFDVYFLIKDDAYSFKFTKYKSSCGYSKDYCWHFVKSKLNDKERNEYLISYQKEKANLEKNVSIDKQIYNKKFRDIFALSKQAITLLKPIILSTSIHKLISVKQDSKTINYFKDFALTLLIYKTISNWIEPKLKDFLDKILLS